jgi:hypothetical protein
MVSPPLRGSILDFCSQSARCGTESSGKRQITNARRKGRYRFFGKIPSMDAFRNARNFGIRRRPNSPECRIALGVVDIDAIQCRDVKMRIEVERIAEELNEADSVIGDKPMTVRIEIRAVSTVRLKRQDASRTNVVASQQGPKRFQSKLRPTGPAISDAVWQHGSDSKNATKLSVLCFKDIGKGHGTWCRSVAGMDASIRHLDRGESAMIETV